MGTQTLSDKKRNMIFINVIISSFATSMLVTALATALPQIVTDFDIPVSVGQWITSGYSLAMAIMIPLTAFLINRFKTKTLYVSALVMFVIGLLLAAIAPNFIIMMVGRVIQAMGNGILTAMAQVLILKIFPVEKRGTAMGWYGLCVGASPVIAPIIAGVIVDNFGWRMIFIVILAIMIVSLIWAIGVMENVLDNTETKFDTVSFILSALAFGGLTLGVGNISAMGFVSVQVLAPFIVGIVALIIFVLRQLKLDDPFLDVRTLKYPAFTISTIGSMIMYILTMGATTLIPLYVQSIKGLSATTSGIIMIPGTLLMTIISPFVGKIYDKVGMKPIFLIGSAGTAIANGLIFFFVKLDTSLIVPTIILVILFVSISCLMMPFVTWGVGAVPPQETSHANALLTALRTLSGAFGIAICVGIYESVGRSAGGDAAGMMKGFDVSFLFMCILCVILFIMAIFGCRKEAK